MGREIAAHRVLFRSFASKSSGRPASRPGQIPPHTFPVTLLLAPVTPAKAGA